MNVQDVYYAIALTAMVSGFFAFLIRSGHYTKREVDVRFTEAREYALHRENCSTIHTELKQSIKDLDGNIEKQNDTMTRILLTVSGNVK